MPLDFGRAVQLFMGTEEELARALGISVADLRASRTTPGRVPKPLLHKLGQVLVERGQGMARVGEMLQEDNG
ncbi:MAG TPA: hypothetical protein VK929_16155 [Longimicrobiales bacterium]|nr:hypothetical protein [Longimicrobiales bacterium]